MTMGVGGDFKMSKTMTLLYFSFFEADTRSNNPNCAPTAGA